MFERPKMGERAICVQVTIPHREPPDLQEFLLLAKAAGAETIDTLECRRDRPCPKYLMGSGSAERLQAMVAAHDASLILFNHDLSPAQERNLERLCRCRVLSRTGLILDIFAQRAQTHEGKLQVELAQLQHLSTRLIRGWTHLERQKGGIGLRGPGETQLETDRRLLNDRITHIKRRLAQITKQRAVSRRSRMKSECPTVSLVGYTNAGKSTLFNRLTKADVLVADQLFATLDPTMRRIELPGFGPVILVDTVGFVQDLPHTLVNAFKSTLEETVMADYLLHVVDMTDEAWRERVAAVEVVLEEIGAHEQPIMMVMNKLDQLPESEQTAQVNENSNETLAISAVTGQGVEAMCERLAKRLASKQITGTIELGADAGACRARLYALNWVLGESINKEGHWVISVQAPLAAWERLSQDYPVLTQLKSPNQM